jgi:hypothetical protein
MKRRSFIAACIGVVMAPWRAILPKEVSSETVERWMKETAMAEKAIRPPLSCRSWCGLGPHCRRKKKCHVRYTRLPDSEIQWNGQTHGLKSYQITLE